MPTWSRGASCSSSRSTHPVRCSAGRPYWASVVLEEPSPPGQTPVVGAARALGILLLGVQLWLLTIALDLYLGGNGGQVWQIALISGDGHLVASSGVGMLWVLARPPRMRRPTGHEAPFAAGASGGPPSKGLTMYSWTWPRST